MLKFESSKKCYGNDTNFSTEHDALTKTLFTAPVQRIGAENWSLFVWKATTCIGILLKSNYRNLTTLFTDLIRLIKTNEMCAKILY